MIWKNLKKPVRKYRIFMAQSGKLVMIAALQIKQLVTECFLYFHVLGL